MLIGLLLRLELRRGALARAAEEKDHEEHAAVFELELV